MEKNIEERLDSYIGKLEGRKTTFLEAFAILGMEEIDINDIEVVDACKTIIHKAVERFKSLMEQSKEAVRWSLLDERQEDFRRMKGELHENLNRYKGYEDEPWRNTINQTLLLLDEGAGGFRRGFINETYYEELLRKEKKRYDEENRDRLENIYKQDFARKRYVYPDETDCKRQMVLYYSNELCNTVFWKKYHELERNDGKMAAYIVEQKEQDYTRINDFFFWWLGLEIAEAHCGEEHELTYPNVIFKDNVDVRKVMNQLGVFVKDEKVLKSQKHWFIAYKVFSEKGWLRNKKQTAFREQMKDAFETVLKCTDSDFRKVNPYFKHNGYTDWSPEAFTAPQCCEEYKKIADTLAHEFQDDRYALPGKTITTRKIVKVR